MKNEEYEVQILHRVDKLLQKKREWKFSSNQREIDTMPDADRDDVLGSRHSHCLWEDLVSAAGDLSGPSYALMPDEKRLAK